MYCIHLFHNKVILNVQYDPQKILLQLYRNRASYSGLNWRLPRNSSSTSLKQSKLFWPQLETYKKFFINFIEKEQVILASTGDFQEILLQLHRNRASYSGINWRLPRFLKDLNIITSLIRKTFASKSSIGLNHPVISTKLYR